MKKMKKFIIQYIRKCRILNFIPRLTYAMSYYNSRYIGIFKWAFTSREDTNYTYDLSDTNLRYLASTISIVTKQPFDVIYGYILEGMDDTELRDYILERIERSEFQSVSDRKCQFGRRLGWYAFVRAMKPSVVIETGIDKGLGSVLLCSALLKNKQEGSVGKYYGTDINPSAGYLLGSKYETVGKILYGDSIESIEKLEVKIDLFINDSDHSAEYEYKEYLAIEKKLNSGAVILGDNAHVTDKLFLFSQITSRNFLFFHEVPKSHWYPGGGIGISF